MDLKRIRKVLSHTLLTVALVTQQLAINVSGVDETTGAIKKYEIINGNIAELISNKGTYNFADNFTYRPEDNGKVWVDKSVSLDEMTLNGNVVSERPSTGNFNVMLSAVAQVYETANSANSASDVVFVLDTSGSMKDNFNGNTAYSMEEMRFYSAINSLNAAIKSVLKPNDKSRVSVVGYSGSSTLSSYSNGVNSFSGIEDISTVLLPLGRYTSNSNGEYLEPWAGGGGYSVDTATGLHDAGGNTFQQRWRYIGGGTYTQGGIAAGCNLLTNSTDRAEETTPVIVLITDGEPGYYRPSVSNFSNLTQERVRSYGHGSPEKLGLGSMGNIGFNNTGSSTIATAVKAKQNLKSSYGKDPLFYTVGIGMEESGWGTAILNPKTGENGNITGSQVMVNNTTMTWDHRGLYEVPEGNTSNTGTHNTGADIKWGLPESDIQYANGAFLNLGDLDALSNALVAINKDINKQTHLPLQEEAGQVGSLTFTDRLGDGMVFKGVAAVRYNGTIFGGDNWIGYTDGEDADGDGIPDSRTYYYPAPAEDTSQVFRGDLQQLPADLVPRTEHNETEYAYTMTTRPAIDWDTLMETGDLVSTVELTFDVPIYAGRQHAGITSGQPRNLNALTIKFSESSDGTTLTWNVPGDMIPEYDLNSVDEYDESYPIRFIYSVGLKDEAQAVNGSTFFTNYYGFGGSTSKAEYTPAADNPYYNAGLLLNEKHQVFNYEGGTDGKDKNLYAMLTTTEKDAVGQGWTNSSVINTLTTRGDSSTRWSITNEYEPKQWEKDDGSGDLDWTDTDPYYYVSSRNSETGQVTVSLGNNGRVNIRGGVPITGTVNLTKVVPSRDAPEMTFEFYLYALRKEVNDPTKFTQVGTDSIAQGSVTGGGTVSLTIPSTSLDGVGPWYFLVKENSPENEPNWEFDSTYYVVEVTATRTVGEDGTENTPIVEYKYGTVKETAGTYSLEGSWSRDLSNLNFTNNYIAPVSAELSFAKKITTAGVPYAGSITDGAFSFKCTKLTSSLDESSTDLILTETDVNVTAGNSGNAISFTENIDYQNWLSEPGDGDTKTIYYVVNEENSVIIPGVTKDNKRYIVGVSVTKGSSGLTVGNIGYWVAPEPTTVNDKFVYNLSNAVSVVNADDRVFTNTYTPLEIAVQKTLDDVDDWQYIPQGGFTFELYASDNNGTIAENAIAVGTTTASDGEAQNIEIPLSSLSGDGPWYFVVKEKSPTNHTDFWDYSDDVYYVRVENDNGTAVIKKTKNKPVNGESNWLTLGTGESLAFTNEFNPDVKIPVKKNVGETDDWTGIPETVSFNLGLYESSANGTVSGRIGNTATITSATQNHQTDLPIPLSSLGGNGPWYFAVREEVPETHIGFWDYSTDVYYVKVTRNAGATVIEYTKSAQITATTEWTVLGSDEALGFTNTAKDVTATINVTKNVVSENADVLPDDTEFTITLKYQDGETPDDTLTVSNTTEDGTFTIDSGWFKNHEVPVDGIYEFTVTEDKTNDTDTDHWTYDGNLTKYVYVKVENITDGTPTVTYYVSNTRVTNFAEVTFDGDGNNVTFTNKWTKNAENKPIVGLKYVDGKLNDAANTFEFGLVRVAENGENLGSYAINNIENDSTGKITFGPAGIEETEGERFIYKITENAPGAGYLGNTQVYYVEMKLNGDKTAWEPHLATLEGGSITSENAVMAADGTSMQFYNYTKPDATLTISDIVKKTLIGADLSAELFSFTLKEANSDWTEKTENGAYTDTKMNDADGNVEFDDIVIELENFVAGNEANLYDESVGSITKTYYYTVTENASDTPGISYDGTKYGIKIEVEYTKGTAETEATFTEKNKTRYGITATGANELADTENATFTNTYTPLEIAVQKTLSGGGNWRYIPQDGFTFELYASDDNGTIAENAIAVATATASDGDAQNIEIPLSSLSESGPWYFMVKEKSPTNHTDFWDYSDDVYYVRVENDNGTAVIQKTEIKPVDGESNWLTLGSDESLAFTNEFNPDVKIPVKKNIEGTTWDGLSDDTAFVMGLYEYTLPEADGENGTEDEVELATVSIKKDSNQRAGDANNVERMADIEIPLSSLGGNGPWYFAVKEEVPETHIGFWDYSADVYYVKVTRNAGATVIEYTKSAPITDETEWTVLDADAALGFTNTAKDVTAIINVTKNVVSENADVLPDDTEFTITLKYADSETPDDSLTVSNTTADGTFTINAEWFKNHEVPENGIYEFTVTEDKTNDTDTDHWTYDENSTKYVYVKVENITDETPTVTYYVSDTQVTNFAGITFDGEGNNVTFTNKWTKDATNKPIVGLKYVDGKLNAAANTFEFGLVRVAENGENLGSYAINNIENDSTGTITFAPAGIEETEGERFIYKITENAPGDGHLGNTQVYYVEMKLNGDKTAWEPHLATLEGGSITSENAAMAADGTSMPFYNYTKPGAMLTISDIVKKTLTGANLSAGLFSFTLKEANSDWTEKTENGAYTDTKMNDADGNVEFDDIVIKLENFVAGNKADLYDGRVGSITKTYYYTVTENASNTPGISYDGTKYGIKIEVEYTKGTAETEATFTEKNKTRYEITAEGENELADTESATFENTYTPLEIAVQKTLDKKGNWEYIPQGGFTFELYASDDDGTIGENTIAVTTATASDGDAQNIEIPLSNLGGDGPWYFVVKEKSPTNHTDFWDYSDDVYYVRVENDNGTAVIKKTENKPVDGESIWLTLGTGEALAFTNEFNPDVKIPVKKNVGETNDWTGIPETVSFNFGLYESSANGTVTGQIGTPVTITSATQNHQTNLPIPLSNLGGNGPWFFVVKEEVPETHIGFWDYSTDVYYVKVMRNAGATVIDYTKSAPITDETEWTVLDADAALGFTNTAKDVTAIINVTKNVVSENADVLPDDTEFTITLKYADSETPDDSLTVSNTTADGTFTINAEWFKNHEVPENGIYEFTVTEDKTNDTDTDHWTYDENSTKYVYVKVENITDETPTVTYYVSDTQVTNFAGITFDGEGNNVTFTNKWTKDATNKPIVGLKYVDGKLNAAANTFEFGLVRVAENGENLGSYAINNIENDSTGTITFAPAGIEETEGERFIYKITENAPGDGHLGNTQVYYVEMKLNGDKTAWEPHLATLEGGSITSENAAMAADGTSMPFYNYTKPGAMLTISDIVKKTLTGANLSAGLFSFTLKEANSDWTEKTENGAYTDTKMNDADGNVEFDDIVIKLENFVAGNKADLYDGRVGSITKTYYYTVTENASNTPGISYDGTKYGIKIEVEYTKGTAETEATFTEKNKTRYEITAEGENELADTESATFENTYTPLEIAVQKTLDKEGNWEYIPQGGFTFELYASDSVGNVGERIGNTVTIKSDTQNHQTDLPIPLSSVGGNGPWYFAVKEEVPETHIGFWDYSTDVYYVTVMRNAGATVIEYTKSAPITDETEWTVLGSNAALGFTNTAKDVTATVNVTKTVDTSEANVKPDDTEFEITLKYSDGTLVAEGISLRAETGTGRFTIEPAWFKTHAVPENKIYEFTVTETKPEPAPANWTYDGNLTKYVYVKVENITAETPTVTYYVSNTQVTDFAGVTFDGDANNVEFINKWTKKIDVDPIVGLKYVDGQVASGTSHDYTFNVDMISGEASSSPTHVLPWVMQNSDGTFSYVCYEPNENYDTRYIYKVYETIEARGYLDNTQVYYVEMKLNDDKTAWEPHLATLNEGEYTADNDVMVGNGTDMIFYNYSAGNTAGSDEFTITKTLNGGNLELEADKFSFTLIKTESDWGENVDGVQLQTVKNNADGTAKFRKPTKSINDILGSASNEELYNPENTTIVRTYYYVIAENNDGVVNVGYDDTKYGYKVTYTYSKGNGNTSGELTATEEFFVIKDGSATPYSDTTMPFTNTYTPLGIAVQKTLDKEGNWEYIPQGGFTFELYASDNNGEIVPGSVAVATATASDGDAQNVEIPLSSLSDDGPWYFVVKEKSPTNHTDFWDYSDDVYYVRVENDNGTAVIKKTENKPVAGESSWLTLGTDAELKFTNEFNPDVKIPVKKNVGETDDWTGIPETVSFNFGLYERSANGTVSGQIGTPVTITSATQNHQTDLPIPLSSLGGNGPWYFAVKEEVPETHIGFWDYSTDVYYVKVARNAGTTVIEYTKSAPITDETEWTVLGSNAALGFTNTAKDVTATVNVTKTVDTSEANVKPDDTEFEITLKYSDGTLVAEGISLSAETGTGTFTIEPAWFKTHAVPENKIYEFTVTETKPEPAPANWTYDGNLTKYVNVKVENITAETPTVTYYVSNTQVTDFAGVTFDGDANNVEFINKWTKKIDVDPIVGLKYVDGQVASGTSHDYTFNVDMISGEASSSPTHVLPWVMQNSDGTFSYVCYEPNENYDTRYIYKVYETIEARGYLDNTQVYYVEMKLNDDKTAWEPHLATLNEGEYTADNDVMVGNGTDMIFYNYSAGNTAGSDEFTITKTLNGADLKLEADKFSFTLIKTESDWGENVDGVQLQTVKNNADGTAKFRKPTKSINDILGSASAEELYKPENTTIVRTYYYVIAENNDGVVNVGYDDTKYGYKVTYTYSKGNGNTSGELTATEEFFVIKDGSATTYSDTTMPFTNTYTPLKIAVQKTLSGGGNWRYVPQGGFTFELYASDDNGTIAENAIAVATATASDGEAQNIEIPLSSLSGDGPWYFVVKEKLPTNHTDFWDYSDDVYYVRVENDNGTAVIKKTENKPINGESDWLTLGTDAELEFTNEFNPDVKIPVKKNIEGTTWDNLSDDTTFVMGLYEYAPPEADGENDEVGKRIGNKVTITSATQNHQTDLQIPLSSLGGNGPWYFAVKEEVPETHIGFWDYSTDVYYVKVTRNAGATVIEYTKSDQITSTTEWTVLGSGAALGFTNKFAPDVEIQVKKNIRGTTWDELSEDTFVMGLYEYTPPEADGESGTVGEEELATVNIKKDSNQPAGDEDNVERMADIKIPANALQGNGPWYFMVNEKEITNSTMAWNRGGPSYIKLENDNGTIKYYKTEDNTIAGDSDGWEDLQEAVIFYNLCAILPPPPQDKPNVTTFNLPMVTPVKKILNYRELENSMFEFKIEQVNEDGSVMEDSEHAETSDVIEDIITDTVDGKIISSGDVKFEEIILGSTELYTRTTGNIAIANTLYFKVTETIGTGEYEYSDEVYWLKVTPVFANGKTSLDIKYAKGAGLTTLDTSFEPLDEGNTGLIFTNTYVKDTNPDPELPTDPTQPPVVTPRPDLASAPDGLEIGDSQAEEQEGSVTDPDSRTGDSLLPATWISFSLLTALAVAVILAKKRKFSD